MLAGYPGGRPEEGITLPGSVFFVAAPAAGHVTVTLPLVRELTRRGIEVVYATGAEQIGATEAAGARGFELPWTLDAGWLSSERFSTTTFVDFLDGLLTSAAPHLDRLVAQGRERDAAAVCFDAAVAPIGIALAQRLGVPAVSVTGSMAVNEHLPLHRLLPPDFRPDNEALVRHAGHLAQFSTDQGLDGPLLPMVQPEVPLRLVFLPAAFQIAADTFDSTWQFVGPTLAPSEDAAASDDRPLLVVSLGSAFTDRPDLFRACADAFAGSSWRVVMATGRTPLAELGPLPANVEATPWIPQQRLLRQATAFVSHAGTTAIMEAFSLGVPLVMLPQVSEHFLNADRVAELGLGVTLDPTDLSPRTLRDTVEGLAEDTVVRDRLSWMANEIAATGGAPRAADAVLELTSAGN
ncbi:macrolide family glycosyltransferase [Amycolatopsis antarctica]|uniref:macrolide family glycosyltransferase n=1 Tax=Amycolatopsis antarctica TaxID=1854586 RepID=UPI0030B810B6